MILALVVAGALLLGQVLGVALVLYVTERHAARSTNLATIGSPTPHPVEISHEPDAEERVARLISEETIARGMQTLRAIYDTSGIPVEDEVLRAEATAMLAGVEPRAPLGLPRD
jgi:hypothetical protein